MQLEILRFIQHFANPVLDAVAVLFTMLGEPLVLAPLFCIIYWCVDKQLGKNLLFALCASLCLNGIVKDLVQAPRPIGEPGIASKRVNTATGYSFPSGHTQSATVFFTTIALYAKKRSIRCVLFLLIVGVGLSRLYLGVHYPADVLGGLFFGLLAAVTFRFLLTHRLHKIAFLLCALLVPMALLLGKSDDTLKAAGMMLGFFIGHAFESKYARFSISGGFSHRLLRLGIGLCLIGIVYLLPKLLLPDHHLYQMLRYGLVVFIGSGVYPWMIVKLKL